MASVTGRAEVMDAVPPGGLGGTFGGNPLSCVAANAVLEEVASAVIEEIQTARAGGARPAGRAETA